MAPSKSVTRKSPSPTEQKQAFDALCAWIEAHLDEPIGWQEMMRESGLDFQTINVLFYRHRSTTPMTWIRRLREARAAGLDAALLPGSGP
jgi:transcriptional regulator GlxA family with amidase domain